MTKSLALFSMVLLLGCSGKVENAPKSKKPVVADTPATVKQPTPAFPSGIFLGVSKEEYGDIAWLICLELTTQKGKLYAPPGVLDLSVTNANGHTILRSKGVGDLVYLFELNPNQQSLVGTVTRLRVYGDASKQLTKSELTLEPLPSQGAWSTLPQFPSGVYKNVKHIEEAGDLLGTELILIRKNESIVGLVTLYEGAPMGPYSLLELSLIDSDLRFKIRSFGKLEIFSGVFSGRQLKLRGESNPFPKDGPLTFQRRSLNTIFGPDCKTEN